MFHKTKQHLNIKASAPLLWRVFAFFAIFVVVSGLLGARIISHGLVDSYGFQFYGGAGKALLFGIIAFLLLAYKRLDSMPYKLFKTNIVALVIAAICFGLAWIGVSDLIAGGAPRLLGQPVLINCLIISTVAFSFIGCFGASALRNIGRTFSRELLTSFVLAVGFYGFLYAVYALWQVLSTAVLYSVSWLLAISGLHATILAPRTLLLSKFGIDIAQYCSGIESIALFSGLYVVFGLVDWKRFNHRRFLGSFIPALVLLFGCNILRVYVLILAGYYINPQIAFSLFHTYAGMVFFIIYSAIFWALAYKRMLSNA